MATTAGETATTNSLLSATSLAPLPDWVDFSLGEDIRDDRRLEQDRQWAKAISDGRVHLSHREFALLYGPRFQAAIEDFHVVRLLVQGMYSPKSSLHKLNELVLNFIVEYAFPGQAPLVSAILSQCQVEHHLASPICQALQEQRQDFLVCVRKRPLLWQEIDMGAYDVTSFPATANGMDSYQQYIELNRRACRREKSESKRKFPQSMRLHEGKLARNGRLLSMTHHHFLFDRVYDATVQTNDICDDVVAPLMVRTLQGQASTMLCFGQTGTGKTYTLDGVLQYVACHLVGHQVRLWFYEVHGKKCYDLLQNRQEIQLRFDGNDQMHACGAHVRMFSCLASADQLRESMQKAMDLRLSEVTERNPISSRSHAVCHIEVLTFRMGSNHSKVGKLTLVDLAGSERNYETQRMTGTMHKESAEINLALMSLKNCFRAYHHHLSRIPYRESTLTKVLKSCFFPTGDSSTSPVGPKSSSISSAVASSATTDESSKSTTSPVDDPREPRGVKSLAEYLSSAKKIAKADVCDIKSDSQKDDDDDDARHFTVIIATISPSPIDLQHSLNTLKHVLLMTRAPVYADPNGKSGELQALPQSSSVSVEIPKTSLAALTSVPMAQWTEEQVISWLATVERGKFAHLVLPKGTNGLALSKLSVQNIAQLFESSEQFGRRGDIGEGPVWVITADLNDPTDVHETNPAPAAVDAPTPMQAQGAQQQPPPPPVPTPTNRKWQAISLALFNAVRREINAYNRQQTLLQQMNDTLQNSRHVHK